MKSKIHVFKVVLLLAFNFMFFRAFAQIVVIQQQPAVEFDCQNTGETLLCTSSNDDRIVIEIPDQGFDVTVALLHKSKGVALREASGENFVGIGHP